MCFENWTEFMYMETVQWFLCFAIIACFGRYDCKDSLEILSWIWAHIVKVLLVEWCVCSRATRPEDVKIKILFCGIFHTDLHKVCNEWGDSKYPLVPGSVLWSLNSTQVLLYDPNFKQEITWSKWSCCNPFVTPLWWARLMSICHGWVHWDGGVWIHAWPGRHEIVEVLMELSSKVPESKFKVGQQVDAWFAPVWAAKNTNWAWSSTATKWFGHTTQWILLMVASPKEVTPQSSLLTTSA